MHDVDVDLILTVHPIEKQIMVAKYSKTAWYLALQFWIVGMACSNTSGLYEHVVIILKKHKLRVNDNSFSKKSWRN